MAVTINTEDPVDIEKEADRTSAIANSVIDALPKILNGTFKLSQHPEFCNLTLTYALYGKIVDNLKDQDVKQTKILPVIIKLLFPDLVQFLPPSIFSLTTQVRRFINKAYRLGHLRSVYQPVSKLYSAKTRSEWADFREWGISQDMLVTGPLTPSSGSQMQLTNKHVILLLNLRNKYHLCWVKVVPQWLRFFGILKADDCVQLQDIKGHWVGLSAQAEKLKGAQLQEFYNTPFILPKSFIRKNIDPVTSSINHKLPSISQRKYISAYLKESKRRVESLKNEVEDLRSEVTSKDKEISQYQKKLSQTENKLEHLATRLCKMRVVKNHWLMKYRSMSGINLFAEDFEFNADLTYAQKIRDGAKYIKRILQLRYSDQNNQFVEKFLDDSFIEELLENILAQGINFEKSSNILSEILQELVKHSQRKSADNSESRNNSDFNSLLMHNKSVPHKNNSTATDDVFVISDSDSSLMDDDFERDQSSTKTPTTSHAKTNNCELIDLCDEKDSKDLSKSKTTNLETLAEPPKSSGSIQNEYSKFQSSKDSLSGLCNDEEMLHNAYVLYDMVTQKRTYDTREEPSKDSGHASQDAITYQPKSKMIRLERQKHSSIDDPEPDPESDSSLSPLFLEDGSCCSPMALKESYVEDDSKASKNDKILSPSKNDQNDKYFEFSKAQRNLWTLTDEYVSSLQPNCTLESNFGGPGVAGIVSLENTTILDPPPSLILNSDQHLQTLNKQKDQDLKIDSPQSLFLENSDCDLRTLDDKQVSQEKHKNSKTGSPPSSILENSDHQLQTLDKGKQVVQEKKSKIDSATELIQDKIQSSSNVFNDFTNTEKQRRGRKLKKKMVSET